MIPGRCKQGIIVSALPVMHNGLKAIIDHHFSDIELHHCTSSAGLSLPVLRRANLVILDVPALVAEAQPECEACYRLIAQVPEVHWIFMVPKSVFGLAVEFLMRPETTLLATTESVEGLVNAVRLGNERAERISQLLLSPYDVHMQGQRNIPNALTSSERQVLRLLAKGWGINQIAQLLKKSNKTISAQKNSAMRRLSLKGNAEMYAWINSFQGVRELNLLSLQKEQAEWNTSQQK